MAAFTAIRNCSDRFEAESLRIRLAEAGIRALITGTDMETALGLGGAGTMRLVRLEVATEDAERATAILEEDERKATESGPWVCIRCQEQNDATFDVCWSCNKQRVTEIPEQQFDTKEPNETVPNETIARAETRNQDQEFVQRAGQLPGLQMSGMVVRKTRPTDQSAGGCVNPYHISPDRTDGDRATSRITLEAPFQEEIARAFRAAVIGVFILPPLVGLYCLYLLVNLPVEAYQASRTKLMLIWIFNLCSISAWMAMWLNMTFHLTG